MTFLKTSLLAATAALGLTQGAVAGDYLGLYDHRPGESIENQGLDLNRLHSLVDVQRVYDRRTGRGYTSVIQRGRNNSAGIAQSGRNNNARVNQRGNNTNVVGNQNGNINSSNVLIFGIL